MDIDEMVDIFDASILREFLNPNGKTPFLQSTRGEGRLVFSLAVDGFNPFQTKAAKQTEQINHFLGLLVDDLLVFWTPGVWFSHTARCDRDRQAHQLQREKLLLLLSSTISDMKENIDMEAWTFPMYLQHIADAKAWRDAKTTAQRKTEEDKRGVRWSELLHLPYWNPAVHTVGESTHALYLDLLHTHCFVIWGMEIGLDDNDVGAGHVGKQIQCPPDAQSAKARAILDQGGDLKALQNCKKPALDNTNTMDKGTMDKESPSSSVRFINRQCAVFGSFEGATETPQESSPAAENVQSHESIALDENPNSPGVQVPKDTETEGERLPMIETAITPVDRKDTKEAKRVLMTETAITPNHLTAFNKLPLRNLVNMVGLSPSNHKKPVLVAMLMDWRKANGRHDTSLSPSDDSSTLQSTRTRQSEVEKEHLINDADQKLSTAATVDKAVLTGYTRAILKELCKRRQLPSYKVENKLFGKAPETKKTDPKAGVLGRKVLGEVRKDMEKTQLPAWVSPVPSNVGSKGHGKLSADHWLTFTTVHLVITLIRLWGAEEGRYKQILDNFIDLVAAVQVAGLRFLTMDNIEFYELIMTRYLKTMKALYRHAKVKAIHHLALHLSDFLRLFGPVHAWRAFAFERYNYILQQENTNGKFGELELTFMKHTSRSANLRPLLDDPHIKKKLSKLVDEYDALRQEDRRGTRIQDTINIHSSDGVPRLDRCQDEQCLSDAQYEALAKKLSEDYPGMIFRAGVTYKIHEVAPKDSNVIFRLSDTTTTAGRITSLFTHERMKPGGRFRKETFLAVEALSDLQEDQVSQDPYRQFHADFGLGRLYQNDYQPHCYVVKPSQIVCHFAKTVLNDLSMPGDFVHALPLNRLRSAASAKTFNDGKTRSTAAHQI
ncbi:hypothetical protein FA95DRAFT_1605300 [Auriscalpium vulgare]|uniref:Uncharacterized protein n=1 Tax=Auriscalpium vulgare TaxID=40419 RepID=A0ACB8RWX1_9AGAM|nr:hypothetical protein FA95DRAFT_1605300 [Auriscalpium vulgare]